MIAARPALPPVFAAMIITAVACRSGDAPTGLGQRSSSAPLSSGRQAQAALHGQAPDVVADVGSLDIHASSVARIAAAQGVDPARALELAVRDALFASEARARELDATPAVRAALRGALARVQLREIDEASVRAGPVTDDELQGATARRFLDLDRPPGARVVHAVVRLGKKDDGPRRQRAAEIAEAIRAALEPVHADEGALRPPSSGEEDPLVERFRRAASAVPHEGFEVVIEALPPVAADGRVLLPGGETFALEFARAAAALASRGDLSPAVVSSFGVHVIMLLERTPAKTVPPEERRRLVYRDVVAARSAAAKEALLARLRQESAVDANADAMLALVPIDALGARAGEPSSAPGPLVIDR